MSERMHHADAAWLQMEEPTSLMVITAVLWFDEPVDWERLKEVVRERLVERYPRFRQRVVPGGLLGTARWEDAPDFRLEDHLRRTKLRAPGGHAELERWVGESMSTPLEFSRPLWELHVIQGYEAGCALLMRVHHCIADGISLARVLLSLTDERAAGGGMATDFEEAGEASGTLDRLLRGARTVVGSTRAAWKRGAQLLAEPIQLMDLAVEGARGASALSRVLTLMNDPPSPFKGQLGREKRVAWSRPVPVGKVREIGHGTGSTVNDVVMAVVAGMLRRYVAARGQPPEDLRAVVPVNLRSLREPIPRELGNRFGVVFLPLPLGVEDPVARLWELKRRMDSLKRSPEAAVVFGMLSAAGMAPAPVERMAVEVMRKKASLVLTNVPGPKRQVYLAGARLSGVMFWVPMAARLGLGLSIFSYAGHVTLGVAADEGLVPEPRELIEDFEAELDSLAEAVRESGHSLPLH
ncbi:wax ester/triacylglycerol synthase family O-acyltransferase [Vitiosangium sp. GDMCC 1.1324]|uniref:WS/DGAT/MGAT family O-acyltransferase n=1 Tax=Vitiosangium sp. (strain GDMCC 1.1324) TaxID=2138576 RepID=UPI000D3C5E86|nr:wax ester/triacylglycerol synthase family O-acyltransferase [Vitiosangium sp. GDMCC 1.1324]PTL82285.1 wax ester/triacylglycerol synthase family O-acyltransferase [Vitiosangium sp. GDMCC 1.1324]